MDDLTSRLGQLSVPELQHQLNTLLNEHLCFLASLVGVQQETGSLLELSRIVLKIIAKDRVLPLINLMLKNEFENTTQAATTLRENTLTTRFVTVYTREIGKPVIKQIFGGVFRDFIIDHPLDIEVDENRLVSETVTREMAKKKSEESMKALTAACIRVCDAIVSPEALQVMPREIRAIAGFTANYALQHSPQQVIQLIGGYLMLRFLNPVLTAPESNDILPAGTEILPATRRSLVLISKVMQNLSNGVSFGVKESYMMPLNSFIDQMKAKLHSFLMDIASDPNAQGTEAFADLKHIPDHPLPIPFSVELDDLILLHRIFYLNRGHVVDGLRKSNIEKSYENIFFEIIDELGVPKDPNIKLTVEDLESERSVRKFMASLSRFNSDALLNLELIKADAKNKSKLKKTVSRDLLKTKKETEDEKEKEKEIKAHQFETLLDIVDKLCHPMLGVDVKKYEGINCCVAKEVVDWLYSNLSLPMRENGIQLGKKLLNANLIIPVKAKSKTKFADDKSLYAFPYDQIEKFQKQLLLNRKTNAAEKFEKRSNQINDENKIANMTSRDWQLLLVGAKVLDFKKDEVVVAEGKPNRQLYRIKSGDASVLKMINGENKLLSVIGPDTMICEMSVLDKDGLTSASIVADSPTIQIWAIDVTFIHDLFSLEPGLCKRFYHYMAVTLAKRLADKKKPEQQQVRRRDSFAPVPQQSTDPQAQPIKEYECTIDKKTTTLQVFPEKIVLSRFSRKTKEVEKLSLHFESKLVAIGKEGTSIVVTSSKKIYIFFKSQSDCDEAFLIINRLWKAEKNKRIKSRVAPVTTNQPQSLQADDMSEEDWQVIFKGSRSLKLKKDQPVVTIGQYSPSMYKVVKGRCRVEVLVETPPPPPKDLNQSAGPSLNSSLNSSLSHSLSSSELSPHAGSLEKPTLLPTLSKSDLTESDHSFANADPLADPRKPKTKPVATLEEGAMFGEVSFLLNGHATASVITESEFVELQVIDDSCLYVLFVRQPALAGRFYRHLAVLLSNRLKNIEKRMVEDSK